MDRNVLMAQLLSRLAAVLAEFDDTGFAPFVERWNAPEEEERQLGLERYDGPLIDVTPGEMATADEVVKLVAEVAVALDAGEDVQQELGCA